MSGTRRTTSDRRATGGRWAGRAPRRGATAHLLAVGRRASAGRGGRRDPRLTVQALCLVLTGMAAALLVWGVQAVHTVYEGRQARVAARVPVAAEPGARPAAWWAQSDDTWGEKVFSVVYVEPADPSAPLPPGLPRLPEPGESFVSPALLDAMPAAATRYGRLAGTIGREGLADAGELFVYVRPPAGVSVKGYATTLGISGFGTERPGDPAYFASQSFDRPEGDFLWLLVPQLGLPVGVLLVVASRLGARQRDRRLAVLFAIGAGRSVRARVAAGEALRPLAAGVVLAGVPLAALTLTGVRLPLTGYEVPAADLAPLRWQFPLTSVGVWAALCLMFAALHLRVRPAGSGRPQAARRPPSAWPGVLCGTGALAVVAGAAVGQAMGLRLFVLGTTLTLVGLPPLLGRAAARAAERLTGRGTANPARLIGGRWAAAHPAVVARAGAALVVMLGLVAQALVLVTDLTAGARNATVLGERLGGGLLEVYSAPPSQEAYARFLTALGPETRVLRVLPGSGTPEGAGPVLRGDCRDLAALGAMRSCPRDRALPVREVYRERTPRTEALRWMSFGSVHVQASASRAALLEAQGPFVVLTGGPEGRERAERAALATLPLPHVDVPGAGSVVGAQARARQAGWVVLVAAAGFLLLALTGAAGLLHAFLDRADELRPLAGYTSGTRFHLRVAYWGMGVPMACVLAPAALAAALLAGVNLGFLSPSGSSPLALLAGGLTVAVTVCAAATVAGGWLAARFTHRWVPRGD
ncbi:hypothetical protein [Streptomyces ficellus]|uniref:ABC transporter permease n=1 Tax=Streptomyces ficellus TaxID=1977088 RepID=A0A6I6FMK4_9ACTN|nr:hypothetical protein [Streptomyces ficellus]QGV80585.1 hypothetical protein EIZ62_21865 [Streptomyces ficellus]